MGVVDDGRRTSARLLNFQLMIDLGRDFNLNLDAKLRPPALARQEDYIPFGRLPTDRRLM